MPRWFAGLCCGIVIVWACIKLYEYQHAAAPAARRLWSSRASDRLSAVGELERFGRADPEVAIPALVNAVHDADSRVRAHAAMALVTIVSGASGSAAPSVRDVKAALEAIGNLLDDAQPDVRATATKALWMTIVMNHVPEGQIDLERATNAVTSGLDDFDPAVRLSRYSRNRNRRTEGSWRTTGEAGCRLGRRQRQTSRCGHRGTGRLSRWPSVLRELAEHGNPNRRADAGIPLDGLKHPD